MSLTYEIDSRLKALIPVLDEHAVWYAGVIGFLFYPEKYDNSECLMMPGSFRTWAELERGGEFVESFVLDNLYNIQSELQRTVHKAAETTMSGEKGRPLIGVFEEMNNLYDQFMIHLRQVEHDCLQANTGIDALTGLRHRKAMDRDLANEMERRARQGRPFTLALAHIDNFDEIRSLIGNDNYKKAIGAAALLIKKCVRSFDDAYRSGEGEFIMVLKHSDLRGGRAAVERMRGLLQEEPIGVRMKDGELKQLTMSYCVAEPLPGESMEDLLKNMREDLQKYDDSGEKALEYIEQSPLQRFISGDDDK